MAIMQTEQLHLIKRLKQQPRLGMADDPIQAASKALKDLFATYKLGAEDVAREDAFGYLADKAQTAYKQINILEQRNRSLTDSFNVSTGRAAQLGFQFDTLSKTLSVNADKLKQYIGELKGLFPGQASYIATSGKFGEQIAKQTEMIRNKFGLSAEAAQGFIKAQTLMGGATANNFDTILKEAAEFGKSLRGEYEGATTEIIEQLGTLDSETLAVYGQNKSGLFKAVIQAKKLGIEMSRVKDIGKSTLDIEQSIANELELQILGAKDINFEKIREAQLTNNAEEITKQLTTMIQENGEQFKKNPFLLEKAASAFGLQESELLDMYAQLQANNALEKDSTANVAARKKEIQDLIDIENTRLGKTMSALEEETFLADKRATDEKMQDDASQAKTENLLSGFDNAKQFAEKVQETARLGMELQNTALKSADTLASSLKDSDIYKALFAGGGVLGVFKDVADTIKSGKLSYTAGAAGGSTGGEKNDLFIPAGGANTVVSGPFGSFTLNKQDDILAAPNIRGAAGGGADAGAIASAVAAALQGMSFQVTNVFDGDKIASSLQIRRGQTMNNLGNIA
jgi:hypothetical protein